CVQVSIECPIVSKAPTSEQASGTDRPLEEAQGCPRLQARLFIVDPNRDCDESVGLWSSRVSKEELLPDSTNE
ncbi:unnamed protein product, partial [Dovyalis caffra]